MEAIKLLKRTFAVILAFAFIVMSCQAVLAEESSSTTDTSDTGEAKKSSEIYEDMGEETISDIDEEYLEKISNDPISETALE